MTNLFEEDLAHAEQKGLLRSLRIIEGWDGRSAVIDGKKVTVFGSNDYLGLSCHPEMQEAVSRFMAGSPFGSGASRLVAGTTKHHVAFEEEIAQFLNKEAALMFSSGYSANVGLMTALLNKNDTVYADRLTHASLLDGARFAGARLKRFKHNNPESLAELLSKNDGKGKKLVVTEGVFSMDGDKPPLAEITKTAKKYGAILLVDDAHGFGVFGENGRGTVDEAGVARQVDIHAVTLGKALGGQGGIIAGSRSLIDGLINFSRSFIYSTAPPQVMAVAGSVALKVVSGTEGKTLRKKLGNNIDLLALGLKKLGLNGSGSHIVPVMVARDKDIVQMGKRMLEQGVLAPAIRPPTVPPGTARFRVSLSASHNEGDISKLLEILGKTL
ncbi:8-amino-7-oxononanoate synthase [hydrothermal vent metagenome]|uniref:8-amino-7-oxononanoate synthase n=1 Tax=hydrothermal vent metagenome TaxID=652676 RepID=A0A3B1CT62_9ZZZZ